MSVRWDAKSVTGVSLQVAVRHSRGVTSWFARQDLSLTSPAERRVVRMVSDLLDQLQPARLDPAEQVIEIDDGETWVKLRHDRDPALEIRFVLSEGWINFYGVMGHDEAYSERAQAPDAWESETIDLLADLLLAEYTFDTYELRGRLWREVLTIGEPYNHVLIAGSRPASLLPLQRWAHLVKTRHSSFECRGTRVSSSG